MKKRILALICVIALLLAIAAIGFSAYADDIDWSFDSDTKTLYITGSGAMDDYSEPYEAPWGVHIIETQSLVVESGVTSLGNYAFAGATSLQSVSLADSVTSIGEGTFSSTPALLSLTLSSSVTSIGDLSFAKNGAEDKAGFALNVSAGSYALHYAIKNGVDFDCESVSSGEQQVNIIGNTGMMVYYPYTAPVDGTYIFYSVSKDDPIGYIYDSEFNQLARNDDHGSVSFDGMADCDFAVSISLAKGETCYFATKIFSPILSASFNAYIVCTNFSVSGNIRAIVSGNGTISETNLNGAMLNGVTTDGTYSLESVSSDYEAVFSYGGATYTHKFNPDDGESVDIVLVVCDQNSDGIVNIRDYSLLLQNELPCIQYFDACLNFTYDNSICHQAN